MKEIIESFVLSIIIVFASFFILLNIFNTQDGLIASVAIIVTTVVIYCTRLVLEKLSELKKELSRKDESLKTTKLEESL